MYETIFAVMTNDDRKIDEYSHQPHEKTRNIFLCDFVVFVANNARYRKLGLFMVKAAFKFQRQHNFT